MTKRPKPKFGVGQVVAIEETTSGKTQLFHIARRHWQAQRGWRGWGYWGRDEEHQFEHELRPLTRKEAGR